MNLQDCERLKGGAGRGMAFIEPGYDRGQSDPDRRRRAGCPDTDPKQKKRQKLLWYKLSGLRRKLLPNGGP